MKIIYNNPIFKKKRRILRKNQTDTERMLWKQLRNRQFLGLKFYRQYSIGDYILDFYCPEKKLAIEVDGGQHAGADTLYHDSKRTQFIEARAIKVIRFWDNEVLENLGGVLEEIEKAITPPTSP